MPNPETAANLRLIKRWQATHDEVYLHRLLKAYASLINITNTKINKILTEDEDSLQECRLGLIDAFNTYDFTLGIKFETHAINRIAFRVYHYIRDKTFLIKPPRDKSKKRPGVLFVEEYILDSYLSNDTNIEDAETRVVMEDAISKLPVRLRKIANLCYGKGLSTKEAAGILGMMPGQAKTLREQARKLLRVTLEPLILGIDKS